jgi:hypothetical protein
MKKFKFIWLLLAFLICVSFVYMHFRNDRLDSLKAFSYFVDLPVKNGKDHATGFFVKYKNDTFFISNYHIFTSSDVTNKKRLDNSWDELRIRIDKNNWYTINIQSIKSKFPFINNTETPDVFAYKCKGFKSKIFIVTLTELNEYSLIDSCITWGYPAEQFFPNNSYKNDVPFLVKSALYKDIVTTEKGLIKKHIGCIIPGGYKGMSGSPVFGLTNDDAKKKTTFILLGVYFNENYQPSLGKTMGFFVKSNEIITFIEKNYYLYFKIPGSFK